MKEKITTRVYATLRQWVFPPEFRIPEPVWPLAWQELLESSDKSSPQANHLLEKEPASILKQEREQRAMHQLLADQATNLWRLRRRMMEPGTNQPKESFRREFRHVEALWDSLHQAGVEVHDPCGEWYDPGLVLKVIAFQPVPGITRQRIQETIKPAVHFHGNPIQMAEVIVETPEKLSGELTEQPSQESATGAQSQDSKPGHNEEPVDTSHDASQSESADLRGGTAPTVAPNPTDHS